jgi:Fe-S protein assembly co-chaperone HscB
MSEDFYNILGVNEKASKDEIKRAYRTLQMKYHPDKNNGNEEAAIMSRKINEAYEVLSSPLKRAAHILRLNGLDVENDVVAPKVDQATLLEVFEMRESGDLSAKDLSQKIKSLLEEVSQNLENKNFASAAQILIRAKYFEKTLQDLKVKKWH